MPRTRAVRLAHPFGVTVRTGPSGSFESRTAIWLSNAATSTHCPLPLLRVLVRQVMHERSSSVMASGLLLPLMLRLAESGKQLSGDIRSGRHCTEMVKDEFIPPDIALFFEEEVAGHAVDVDDVRNGCLSELQERE